MFGKFAMHYNTVAIFLMRDIMKCRLLDKIKILEARSMMLNSSGKLHISYISFHITFT